MTTDPVVIPYSAVHPPQCADCDAPMQTVTVRGVRSWRCPWRSSSKPPTSEMNPCGRPYRRKEATAPSGLWENARRPE